jgi:hypothetical protein
LVTEKNQDYYIDNSSNVNSKLFWDPQLYIDNAIGDVKEKDVKYRIGKYFDDIKQDWFLEVHMIKRIQGTFFEKLELYHFPFDVQGWFLNKSFEATNFFCCYISLNSTGIK